MHRGALILQLRSKSRKLFAKRFTPRDREAVRRHIRRFTIATSDDGSAIRLYGASLMRHRYLWGHLHIAKHIEPRQMAAGTRETAEYSSR